MNTYVALLRGINVGTAKTVPMPALAAVFEGLGFGGVRTVLRSGNVVFDGQETRQGDAAASVERALLASTGVQSRVLVLTAERFRTVAAENPLGDAVTDGSKGFITFLSSPPPAGLRRLTDDELSPERLRVTDAALYQWIPAGSLQSKLGRAFWAQFGTTVTTRNLNTVRRLLAVLGD